VYWAYAVRLSTGGVYVGDTGKSPSARLRAHKAGGKTSSGIVRRRGRQIVARRGPFATRAEALRAAGELAREYRARGVVVRGGAGRCCHIGKHVM